jgi:hypothetical protein
MWYRINTLALGVCLQIAFAATAMANGTCSTATIQGTYALSYTGYMPSDPRPFAAVGTVKFDRSANPVTLNIDISNSTGSVPVSYPPSPPSPPPTIFPKLTVNSDCTGTVDWNSGTGPWPSSTEQMVILNNGDEIRLMNNHAVSSGTAYRMTSSPQGIRNCQLNTASGVYAQTCNGNFNFISADLQGPGSFIGTLKSKGDGTFTGNGTLVASSTSGTQHILTNYTTGTTSFTLGPDCRGTATFSFDGVPGTWSERIVVFNQGKEMITTTTRVDTMPQQSELANIDLCHLTKIAP